MSKPSSNKHSTSTLTHDEVIISIASPSEASSSSSSPSELKGNNVNKFWKALKQNLTNYCWWSCFKPVVVSKMKENPSTERSNSTTTTTTLKSMKTMKTTSMNATAGSYSNMCVNEHDQMIKEAIFYCKKSMNQVSSVVDLEAFEINQHSNESVLDGAGSKAFVDNSSTDQEQVRAANVSAATMVSVPSADDVLQEEEEENFARFSSLNNVEPPLDGEETTFEKITEKNVSSFANEEEPCLGEESELRSPLPMSATEALLRKKDLLIEMLENEIKELIPQPILAQSRLDDLLQEVVEDNFLFDGTSPQISMGTPKFAGCDDPHQAWEKILITQGTGEDTTEDGLCKEIRCIEMEESSTNRNVDSLTLSPEEESKEGISSLTMVANGDLTYQEPVVASSANTNAELISLVRTDSAFCFHFPQYIY